MSRTFQFRCRCGKVLKEEPQLPGLNHDFALTVGTCCADTLPETHQHLAMVPTLPNAD